MQLNIQDLAKRIGKLDILRDVNLRIDNSKSIVFLGPSGGGKSTLVKLISGLGIPDRGIVELNGVPIPSTEKELRKHRKSIGIVFQSYNLFPHLTALDNISLPLIHVHGISKQEAHDRAFDLLSRFEMRAHASKKPGELSGGQSQRVAIIRAVAIQPRLFIFDEPTSALDPIMTAEVLDLIMELKSAGSDFILVSHHLTFAKKIADEIVFIQNGRVIEASPGNTFFERPQSKEAQDFLAKLLKY